MVSGRRNQKLVEKSNLDEYETDHPSPIGGSRANRNCKRPYCKARTERGPGRAGLEVRITYSTLLIHDVMPKVSVQIRYFDHFITYCTPPCDDACHARDASMPTSRVHCHGCGQGQFDISIKPYLGYVFKALIATHPIPQTLSQTPCGY